MFHDKDSFEENIEEQIYSHTVSLSYGIQLPPCAILYTLRSAIELVHAKHNSRFFHCSYDILSVLLGQRSWLYRERCQHRLL